MQWKCQARKHVVLVAVSFIALCLLGKASGQNMEQYTPLDMGMCQDVGKACILMIRKDTPLYYAVIENGKVLAITKMVNGKETVEWGKLPVVLKKGEKEL